MHRIDIQALTLFSIF